MAVGDLDGGTGALTFRSVAAGRKVGVVADDSVLEPAVDKDTLPGLVDLEGSWKLFLRDRGAAPPAAGPREGARDDAAVGLRVVGARLAGLVGEDSREAKGEGATDEAQETEEDAAGAADVAEVVCEASLLEEDHGSDLGFAAELEVDSRASVGSGFDGVCACACVCWPAWVTVLWGLVVGIWERLGGEGEEADAVIFGDLSMFALTAGSRLLLLLRGRGRPTTEGMGTVLDHTCQASQEQRRSVV